MIAVQSRTAFELDSDWNSMAGRRNIMLRVAGGFYSWEHADFHIWWDRNKNGKSLTSMGFKTWFRLECTHKSLSSSWRPCERVPNKGRGHSTTRQVSFSCLSCSKTRYSWRGCDVLSWGMRFVTFITRLQGNELSHVSLIGPEHLSTSMNRRRLKTVISYVIFEVICHVRSQSD